MAIVELHCVVCCKPESEGHRPFCPVIKAEPEYRVVYGDNGTLRGTETWWHKDDPRAPFNQKIKQSSIPTKQSKTINHG